ncbi:MAG TPA: BlaI/MecI/CopY family transcriptional regulator [Pseudonocardiaceae bacterium]
MEAGREDTAGAGRAARRRSGELSSLVLDVLRRAGRALTPAEVLGELNDLGAGPLAYTTVVTILSRLHTQGYAERFRSGRAYAYLAVADPVLLAARRMRRMLDGEDDRDAVLASFVHTLSSRDERLLRDLLGPDLGEDEDTDGTDGIPSSDDTGRPGGPGLPDR